MPFASAQGTTFTFDGEEYQCTSIRVAVANADGGTGKIDVSTLDLADGALRVYQDAPLVDPNSPYTDEDGSQTTITGSFFGNTIPMSGATGTLETAGISGEFRCTQAEQEYAVGDIVKGTATFVSAPAGS